MSLIQEVFMETDWDEGVSARQLRDQRMQELQAQGLICTSENLYNVQGQRVFVLVASPPPKERMSRNEGMPTREERSASADPSSAPTRPLPHRPVRSLPTFETR
ncbi:MAG: hypothetical protein HC772_09725 [Leptolyngbyaceae cyanobacterium CRU_2_3]|nr:hypothetical protein [Leptolyngbyaceae cyanobacterium CRU_2_3]